MSLAIDVDEVVAVLLSDGWHEVLDKSFTMDSYEYIWRYEGFNEGRDDPVVLLGGGQSGIYATGFQFKTGKSEWLAGPVSAIQAVRTVKA